MGKKKIEHVELIQDKISRNVTFCKRKKGLIKKAMEMSILCGQEVAVYIYDRERKKFVTYNSTSNFDYSKIGDHIKRHSKNNQFEQYTNADYDTVCDSKVITAQSIKDPIRAGCKSLTNLRAEIGNVNEESPSYSDAQPDQHLQEA